MEARSARWLTMIDRIYAIVLIIATLVSLWFYYHQ